MPMSNFSGGFADGISIRGLPLTVAQPGEIFWVGNSTALVRGQKGGSDGNNGTFNAPFATLDYAIGRCTAGRGDIIMVRPGHTETISSATALALDVAGVAVIGLGTGTARPTFTLDTANTATIAVSAANVTLYNLLFVGNFLSIATVFTLTTAANFNVDSCEFRDTSSILGFLTIVTTSSTANAADGLTMVNNLVTSASTSATAMVILAGTTARLTLRRNRVFHSGATNNVAAFLEHGALVVSNALIESNMVYSVNTDTATGALLIKTTATTGSGIVRDNVVRALDVAAALIITAGAVQYGMFNNLYIGDGTQNSGFLLPAVGSDA